HGGGQGAVGNVDQAVDEAEDDVGDEGVDDLGLEAKAARHGEDGHREEEQGDSAEEYEGAELPPAGHGAVHQAARHDVGGRVPDADEEKERPHQRQGQPGDVGVVEEQK